MIIEPDFAEDIFNLIEEEIYNAFAQGRIIKKDGRIKLKEFNYDYIYNKDRFCLPLDTRTVTNYIQVSKLHTEVYYNAIQDKHPELVRDGLQNAIDNSFETEHPDEAIFSVIYDKISALAFDYNKVLTTTRQVDNLYGIKDEEKILLNHLNKYNEILKSHTIQLDFFYGIILNKKISDLLTQIYVRFISLRLKILNPSIETLESSYKPESEVSNKIIWNGNQNELCELFVQLQNKGWVSKFEAGLMAKSCRAISNLFDLSLTQLKKDSNTQRSFNQIMKGEFDKKTGERTYGNVFKKGYKYQFDKIESIEEGKTK